MNYNAENIVSLSAGRAFREKIGMYLSADRQEAINLGLRELIVNVQDEYEVFKPKNPYCKIELDTKQRIIIVSDNMRGIPVGIRQDGINSLTAAFLIPHSGGKHTEGAYSSAIGINGEGNKVVCHTASWLEVEVKRDGKIYYQKFISDEEGAKPLAEVAIIGTSTETGTKITYSPDKRVYGDIFIDIEKLRQMLQELSYFTKGLKIVLIIDKAEEVFYSQNGLIDGLKHEEAISTPFSYFYETSDCKVELALQWVADKGQIKGYANGLYMPDGGAFISGFKTSLTKTFNNLANTKFDGEKIRAVLNGFVSVKVKVGQFSNQAKTALANPEARTATCAAITNLLKEYVIKHKDTFETVINILTKVTKAEAAAERARKKVLDATKDIERNTKAKAFSNEKLKDAEYLGQDSVLLLVEGNSAAASMAVARDVKKYGILALRGKCINCMSNSEEDIFDNEEIKLLLTALGVTPHNYSASKLRYGRIAICVDADSDGMHIALLIMAALQYLIPQFLKEGRLYWLRSPLYIVKNGTKESYYFTDADMDKVRGKITGVVQRNKGLGALSASQAKASMFDPATQRLEQVCIGTDAVELLMSLMGPDASLRRDFIFNNIDFHTIRE